MGLLVKYFGYYLGCFGGGVCCGIGKFELCKLYLMRFLGYLLGYLLLGYLFVYKIL